MNRYLDSLLVPRAGVEPARVAPLVFETSASTDSAIWALFYSGVPEQMRCKGSVFFDSHQIFDAVFCGRRHGSGKKRMRGCKMRGKMAVRMTNGAQKRRGG